MKRFEERKQDLAKATERLKEALCEKETELAIDGTLHSMENHEGFYGIQWDYRFNR